MVPAQGAPSQFDGAVVVMGVAGCGKSTLGVACAQQLLVPFVEGDDFHSQASRQKMHGGIPLTDEDRAAWFDVLGQRLAAREGGVVMACSALRLAYRERLRRAAPDVRFVFLELGRAEAERRVAARKGHLFPAKLVASQFDTLENPRAEPGVLVVDATRPVPELCRSVCSWLIQTLTASHL